MDDLPDLLLGNHCCDNCYHADRNLLISYVENMSGRRVLNAPGDQLCPSLACRLEPPAIDAEHPNHGRNQKRSKFDERFILLDLQSAKHCKNLAKLIRNLGTEFYEL